MVERSDLVSATGHERAEFAALSGVVETQASLGPAGNPTSKLDGCVVFVFTKDGLTRLRKSLPGLVGKPLPVMVLDDSLADSTRKWIECEFGGTNITYHGGAEQAEVLATGMLPPIENLLPHLGQDRWQLGLCRNYAVVLARLQGFERMLMVDDDILIEDFKTVVGTFHLLSDFTLVGASTRGMPDDSVVGHIAREIGWPSSEFVSGQYLALDTTALLYYFPNVYNEDWIFALLHACDRRIARHSTVVQLAYDPFDTLKRSLFQEFGEILCDGLIEAKLVQRNLHLLQAVNFWSSVCERRRRLLTRLQASLDTVVSRSSRRHIVQALLSYHRTIRPEQFRSFWLQYDDGLSAWRSALQSMLA